MLANYGYKDGSGDFFITIDTERCAECADHPCVAACPAGVLEIIDDDYDDERLRGQGGAPQADQVLLRAVQAGVGVDHAPLHRGLSGESSGPLVVRGSRG